MTSLSLAVAPVLSLNRKSTKFEIASNNLWASPLAARPTLDPDAMALDWLYSPFCKSPLNIISMTVSKSFCADPRLETNLASAELSLAGFAPKITFPVSVSVAVGSPDAGC